MYQSFEDLEVWQVSLDLSVEIYATLKACRDYGFKDQLCRSSVSVPSNVAEGMERHSKKETIHFLHIAKGSCAEMRTQLMIATRIGYMEKAVANEMLERAKGISRMLHGLIKSLHDKN
ncbi:MAG: four helix bundle protein [Pontiella sp.]